MTESGGDLPVWSEAVDAVGGRLQQRCAPCWLDKKTIPASVYCKNCKEFLCVECSFYHKRFSFMSDHDIVDPHQAEEPGEQRVKMYGYDKCSVHGTSVEIYCEDHDVFICAKCAFSDHKRCENAKHISEFSIDTTLEAFKEKLTKCCETAYKFIESVNEIGNKEKEKGRAKAEQIKSEFCEKIDKELAEFVNEIDYKADSARSSFQHNVAEVSNIHLELEMWMKNLCAAIQNGLSVESFILCKSLKTSVMKHEEFLKQQVIEDTYITTCINTEYVFKKKSDITVQVNSSDFEHQDKDSKLNTVSRTIVSVNRKAMVPVKTYKNSLYISVLLLYIKVQLLNVSL
ncbi:uncharacterized protein LOC128215342 [Mya arenaria]|uniref:uncharacterized protein LOC128215342 n=1 Tax=Mya arenaria TaxID=6604 RepID=UPI0022E2A1D7|nr:uncharacterized protein LOC128215342 [Mya arenaria]